MTFRLALTLAFCSIGLAAAPPAAAAQPPRDRLADTLALPLASNLTGARDTGIFAWTENEAGVRNIWVARPGQAARRVTAFISDDGQQLYDIALSDDGSKIAYVRGGDDEFPDEALPNAATLVESPAQQVYIASTDAPAPARVGQGHSPVFDPTGRRLAFTRKGEIWLSHDGAPAVKIATLRGDVSRLQWSPDGTRLLLRESRGDYSFIALLDLAGARLQYLDPALGHSVEPIFSPDGSKVAFIRYLDPPAGTKPGKGAYWSIRLVDTASGKARSLWTSPAGQGGRFAGTRSRNLFWGEGNRLIFPWERSGWLHVYAIDADKGGEPRELKPGDYEVETFLLSPDRRALIFAANADELDRRHIWRVPLGGGRAQRLTDGGGIESFPTFAADQLAVIATDVSHPAHPALVEKSLVPLGRRPSAAGLPAPETVVFRAEDGLEIRGQLFRAPGPGRKPAIVHVHGGPRRQMLLGYHPSGYYSNAYAMNRYLASQGYNVLTVNYRSGTGYGQAFRDAPQIAREGAAEYRDILAAGRWLEAQSFVDPDAIGIWGGSWGGYLTALALARDSDLFKAGVNFHGVHSLLRSLPNSMAPQAQEEARRLQWESSPLGAIDSWRSPVLLIHGDDDRNVDFGQSLMLARELAARDIPYEELVYPNERHTFIRHDHWFESLRATAAFFDKHLKTK